MPEASIYQSPDIRTQSIDKALEHIEAKRARRMVIVMDYKEKANAALEKAAAKDQDRFAKQVERCEAALEQLDKRFTMVVNAVEKLKDIHNNLVNIDAAKEDRL